MTHWQYVRKNYFSHLSRNPALLVVVAGLLVFPFFPESGVSWIATAVLAPFLLFFAPFYSASVEYWELEEERAEKAEREKKG